MAIKRILTVLLCLALGTSLSGCSRVAKKLLPDDHLNYNRAVNTSINRQLLINIVRAHFNESALYVSIENVTSRHTYQDQMGYSLLVPFNKGGVASQLNTLTVNGNSLIKEEPSFIYTPQTNDKYAVELLQPLRIKAIYLVIESESDIGDILRLMLRRIGPYVNFEARPIVRDYQHNIASIKKFIRLTQIIGKIYASNDYTIYLQSNRNIDKEQLRIPIPSHMKLSPREWRLLASIGITHKSRAIILCAGNRSTANNVVHIQVRSLVNVNDFLSFAVVPPQNEHKRQLLNSDNGKTFRVFQKLLTKYMMHIRVSRQDPGDAFVKVQRRGYWYYINEKDTSSKITFRLFRIFNDLTQAGSKGNNILISS